MLDKEMFNDIRLEDRAQYLRDNCDAVEEITYSKSFSSEELAEQREALTDLSIKIADIEAELDEAKKQYKEMLKPLYKDKAVAIENLKKKAQVVTENCCKFFDEETKMIGYYNDEGKLVNSRPAFPNEMQGNLFRINVPKTGTDN